MQAQKLISLQCTFCAFRAQKLQYLSSVRRITTMSTIRHNRFATNHLLQRRIVNPTRLCLLSSHQSRSIWLPPIWLRPLLRPLAIALIGFLSGIIVQLWHGEPPKWLLASNVTEEAAAGQSAAAAAKSFLWVQRIIGGSVLFTALYITRLRNPVWASFLGPVEHNLQLADDLATLPLNAYWDTRSANDSMKARMSRVESHLGSALSAGGAGDSDIDARVETIRVKAYTNGATVALGRVEHHAQVGDLDNFDKDFELLEHYLVEGAQSDNQKIKSVKVLAFGTKCGQLLSVAQTKANQGDVSGCSAAIAEIRTIRRKAGDELELGVSEEDFGTTLKRAHQFHVSHLLEDAQKMRKKGSRVQANTVIEQARGYANTYDVNFDETRAEQILR